VHPTEEKAQQSGMQTKIPKGTAIEGGWTERLEKDV